MRRMWSTREWEKQLLDVKGERSAVGTGLWDRENLTISPLQAPRHCRAGMAPLSLLFSVMVLSSAERLLSAGCSQESLLMHTKGILGRTRGEKELWGCSCYAQRLCVWSGRTTCKIKTTTSLSSINNSSLAVSWGHPAFCDGLIHLGVRHQARISDVISFFLLFWFLSLFQFPFLISSNA